MRQKAFVTDVIRVDNANMYYILDNLGNVSYILDSSTSTNLLDVALNFVGKSGQVITENVFKIKASTSTATPLIIFKTNQGYWCNDSSSSTLVRKTTILASENQEIVHMFGIINDTLFSYTNTHYMTYITEDSKWNTRGNFAKVIGGIKDSTVFTKYRENWMFDSNIIAEAKLSDFDVTPELVYSREDAMDIGFSVLHKKEVIGFNLYYAPALYLEDKTKWVEIETNVAKETLLKSTEDSGYKHQDGTAILKSNYVYNWKIPNKNLVDIVIIVEPIFGGV